MVGLADKCNRLTGRSSSRSGGQTLPALWKEAEINVVNLMLVATFRLLGRGVSDIRRTSFVASQEETGSGLSHNRVFVCYGGSVETEYLEWWVFFVLSPHVKVVCSFLSRRRLGKFSNVSWANCASELATTACAMKKKGVFFPFTFANAKLAHRPRALINTPCLFWSGQLCWVMSSWISPLW